MEADEMQDDYESVIEAIAEEDMDAARVYLGRMLDRDANDPRTLEISGDFARIRGDYRKAERLYARLPEVSSDPRWLGVSLMSRGYLALEQDERPSACELFQQALSVFSDLGDAERCSEVLASLATAQEELGNFAEAREAFQQALDIRLKLLEQEAEADTELVDFGLFIVASLERELGTVQRLTGKLEDAEALFTSAQTRFTQLDERAEVASVLDCLAVIRQIQGRYTEAEALLQTAIEINQQEEDLEGLSVNYGNMAILHKHLKQFDQAEDYLRLAHQIDEEMEREDGIADFHMKMGEVYYERGDWAAAEQQLLKALKLHKATRMPEGVSATYAHLGVLYRYQEDYPQSEKMTRLALQLAEEMNQVDFMAGALDELALLRKLQGDREEARRLWERSLQLFTELDSAKMISEVSEHLRHLDEV